MPSNKFNIEEWMIYYEKITNITCAPVFIGSIFVINNENAQAADFEKAFAKKTILVKSVPGESYKTLGKLKAKTSVKVYGGVPIGKDQEDLRRLLNNLT